MLVFAERVTVLEDEVYLEASLPRAVVRLPVIAAGTHPFRKDFFGTVWACIARQRGPVYMLSGVIEVTALPPVRRLEARQTGDASLWLEWDWPERCPRAEVEISADGGPAQPRIVERTAGERGGFAVSTEEGSRVIAIRVWATSQDGKLRSAPIGKTARLHRQMRMIYWMTASERPFWKSSLRGGQLKSCLHVTLDRSERVPAFVVRFHPDRIPSGGPAVSGPWVEEIYRHSSTEAVDGGVTLDLTSQLKGRRGYVGIALVDPEDMTQVKQIVPRGGMNGARTY